MPRFRFAVLALVAACSSRPVVGPAGGSGGTGGESAVELCGDGLDNDGNGLSDCADPACAGDPLCPRCGDGLRQGSEACEGEDLGDASCLSQHFNGGGRLHCTAHCTLDTSECSAHEDCGVPGDEDGNGLSDCADPACATLASCLTLDVVDPPIHPYVTSARTLVFSVRDGTGAPVGGKAVHLGAPAGAMAPTVSMPSGPDGLARFDIRLGRKSGSQSFVASLDGSDLLDAVELDAVDPPAGYVHTVLNAGHVSGTDSSGSAAAAHVGAIVDLALAADGTIYAAEACRILVISPQGVLSVLAGTRSCGSTPDGVQASGSALSVAALALDESRGRLVFLDPSSGTARYVDLVSGILSTLAGGGTGLDGGPAVGAALAANALAVGKDGTTFLSDAGSQAVRQVSADGVITTVLAADRGCSGGAAVAYCDVARCRPILDAAGRLFVAGAICGSSVDAVHLLRPSPGIVRASQGPLGESIAVHVAGNAGGSPPKGQSASQVLLDPVSGGAFDGAGNLLAFSGPRLLRIDSITWAATTLASWETPTFGGELVPVDRASFQAPSALVFGGPDLYVADVDGTVRRVVNPGTSTPHPALDVTTASGDGGSADLEQLLTEPVGVAVQDAGISVPGIPVQLEADDPGIAIYPGSYTDQNGIASTTVRMGLTPGPHSIRAFPLDIHGDAGLKGDVIGVTAIEPPQGTILSLTSSDVPDAPETRGPFIALPGQVLPSTRADFGPVAMALDPDGVVFAATSQAQILMIDRQGALHLVGGIAQQDDASDGDGGPALKARMVATALAVTRDAVYFLERNQPYRFRVIDRRTGIVTTIVEGTYFSAISRDLDGSILLSGPGGIERLEPATGERKVLVPGHAHCSDGDGLGARIDGLAASGNGIFFSGVVCTGGQGDLWLGSADPNGNLSLIVRADAYRLATTPDGQVAWEPGANVTVTDPTTLASSYVVGPWTGFGEDVPATQSWAYSGGDLAYDPDGHLFLVADQRIRIVW